MSEQEDPKREIPELLRNIPPEVLEKIVESATKDVLGRFQPEIDSAMDKINHNLIPQINGLTRTVKQLDKKYQDMRTEVQFVTKSIQEMANKFGDSSSEVLRKALALYEIAAEVAAQGNRLAILTPEDEIVREIINFGPSPQPTA